MDVHTPKYGTIGCDPWPTQKRVELDSRLTCRCESKSRFDDVHVVLKSAQFHGFCVSFVSHVRQNFFPFLQNASELYCGLHQIWSDAARKSLRSSSPSSFAKPMLGFSFPGKENHISWVWILHQLLFRDGSSNCEPHTACPPASTCFLVDAARTNLISRYL